MWTAILIASIVCVVLKTLGYLIPPQWLEAPRPAHRDLLTVALLAASSPCRRSVRARPSSWMPVFPPCSSPQGCCMLRAPFLVVVAAAAVVAALLRLWGWAA